MAKSKCKWCECRLESAKGIKTPLGFFCNHDHAMKYGLDNKEKGRKKLMAKRNQEKQAKIKIEREKTTQRKKELKTRRQWLDQLQKLVNQYVTKVRDVNQKCCTCDRATLTSSFDAGHFLTRGARPDIRFELTNIHKQCVSCNQYNGGRPKEYIDFIVKKYGQEHLDWLECQANHKPLKEQFTHWSDIEKEILRYRKLLRENGVKPIA